MSVEIFRNGIRVSAMFPDAQRQGLEPLDGLEGVEGTDCSPQVPQQGDPGLDNICLLYTSPSPRDVEESRMPSSA